MSTSAALLSTLAAPAETSSAPVNATLVAAFIALVATVLAAVIAVGWPTWRAWQTGRRFLRLIRRELEEIRPRVPLEVPGGKPKPWWQYLSKRFVHEEFLTREHIAAHRDFVLTLDPTVVYLVSQLWIAFEKRDFTQWLHFLSELAQNPKVRTKRLEKAVDEWRLIPIDPDSTESVRGSTDQLRSSVSVISGLFEARLDAYQDLMVLLAPATLRQNRERLTSDDAQPDTLRHWYLRHGLLLSGDALHHYLQLKELLEEQQDPKQHDLDAKLSALRTELKIDLGVRHPDERDEPTDRVRRRV